MSRILVTGFEPFGGETVNPAQELLRAIEGTVDTVLLPVTYKTSIEVLERKLDEVKPDTVLCLGQAGGRAVLTLERVGVNWQGASIADNDGLLLTGEPIDPAAPGGYLTTLPIDEMKEAMNAAGAPTQISLSAGTFICNRVLYGALHYAALKRPSMKAGFMHVPFLPTQTAGKPTAYPSMPLDLMLTGLRAALDVLK